MSGNPILIYEWRHTQVQKRPRGAHTDTGSHGALLKALSFTTLLYLTEQSFPTQATSTASLQIPAVNDQVWEQREATQLHSQTLGKVSASCITLVWLLHDALAYHSGLSFKIY